MVSEHIVRRAVREDRSITGVRTFVPHTHALAIRAEALANAVDLAELGAVQPCDGWLILLPTIDDEVEGKDALDALVETWRRLFHARIDETLGAQIARGELTRARMLEVVDRVGQIPMDEARTVLEDESLAGAGSDEMRELVELVALYAELRFFAPDLLSHYFPSLVDRADVAAMFDQLVPAAALFEETRLAGAPDPIAHRAAGLAGHDEDEKLPGWRIRSLLEATRKATQHERDVDALLAAWRARQVSQKGSAEHQDASALEAGALAALGKKLAALAGRPDDASEWASAVASLVPHAKRGMTSVEGRLLHDLQRACDDADGELTSVDLGRFLRSFGRSPVRRAEPVRQMVAVARHLARALARLPATHVNDAERRRLKRLLGDVAHQREAAVRERVGAVLEAGLVRSKLVARDIPEQVAARKLVAELCDRLLAKGFIAFPDIRDQVARNQLKLDDLKNPIEWVLGDALIVLDRYCKAELGGAYRAAEIYRRFFQRVSSLVFANPLGRLAVRYAILPFGGAAILLKGFDLVILSLVGMLLGLEKIPPAADAPPGTPHEHPLAIFSLPLFVTVGVLLFGVLHWPAFRAGVGRVFRAIGRGLRFTFVELPRRFRALPWVEALVKTRAFELFHAQLWRPLFYAFVPTLLAVIIAGDSQLWLWVGVPLTAALSLFFWTRPGRRFVEASRDWWVQGLRDLKNDIIPGVIGAVLEFFKKVVERVEVVLYVVDQWLRYRRGDSRLGVALKAFFGLLWSVVAYLVRLIVNLVAEPQLNPIKHFPVVTVAHKVTIPWSLAVFESLKEAGMGEAAASFLGLVAFQLIVPGLAGFLVWEFKENWRLYRANRKPALMPVIVGSHGEPVYRLLRPGFHSGTVPTLFKKLRKAERQGKALIARRLHEDLHHVEEAMERFVERELKALLVTSGQLPEAAALQVEHVHLTPARISIEIGCPALGPQPMCLAFEEQSRFLIAHVAERGFLASLGDEPSAPRRAAFATALLGLYKLAGVDLVRSQITRALPSGAAYDINDRGLVVWLAGYTTEVVYPLRFDLPALAPSSSKPPTSGLPTIRTIDLAFSKRVIPWREWTSAWGDANATLALRDRVMGDHLLLPVMPRSPLPA